MNVFYLDPYPPKCAEQHCDAHVRKMMVEYAQILSTNHRVLNGKSFVGRTTNGRKITRWFHDDPMMNEELYKSTHVYHPSTVWARQSTQNYNWLYDLWCELSKQYEKLYGKEHLSFTKLEKLLLLPPKGLEASGFTQPPPAMKKYPHCIVEGDSVQSYRNFYIEDKARFAVWSNRDEPDWWIKNG